MTAQIGFSTRPAWLALPELADPAAPAGGPRPASFSQLLLDSLSATSELDLQSQAAIQQQLAGEEISQVEVFTAVKKADLSLRMMLQIRNKLVDAWQEIQQLRM